LLSGFLPAHFKEFCNVIFYKLCYIVHGTVIHGYKYEAL